MEHKSIDEVLAKARETLEKETFDASEWKKVTKEFLDSLENFSGLLFRDIGRIIRQRYPVVTRSHELARRYVFAGVPSETPDSATLTITIDNSGTSDIIPTIEGIFAPKPFVNVSVPSPATITVTLNGSQVDPTYLSDIVLRQPARIEAIRFIKDGAMTLSEFHAINVRYALYGIWGNRQDLETYSLGQYAKEENFKDSPLTVGKGVVLDGNTGISLLNFPSIPAGQSRVFTMVLYIGAYSTPGLHIGGRRPRPIRPSIGGRVPVRPIRPMFFDENYDEEGEEE